MKINKIFNLLKTQGFMFFLPFKGTWQDVLYAGKTEKGLE